MEPLVHKLFNLESELMSCEWIVEKVKTDEAYAQNLYAALCNNLFVKNEVIPILKEDYWHCSWRYAGGIIADIRQSGDYLDWYCSGIIGATYDNVADEALFRKKQYVSEGQVTEEIKNDLLKLGWIINEDSKD